MSLAALFKVSLEEIKEDLTGIPSSEPLESQLYYMEDAEEDVEGAHSDVEVLIDNARYLSETMTVANESLMAGAPAIMVDKFLQVGLNSAYRSIGAEGYTEEVSMESTKDNIKAFLQSVGRAIKAAWEKVKDFFAMFFNAAKTVSAKADHLIGVVNSSDKKEFTVDSNFHGSVFKTAGTAIKALMAGMQHVAAGAQRWDSITLKTADIEISKLQLPYYLKVSGNRIVGTVSADITAGKVVTASNVIEVLQEIKSVATIANDLKHVVKTADQAIGNVVALFMNNALYNQDSNRDDVLNKLNGMSTELAKYQKAAVTISKDTLHVANRQLNLVAKSA